MPHAEYFYLTDRETVGGVLAFDPKEGWVDFVPDVTEAERVWEGRNGVPGTPASKLPGWLAARSGRPVVHLGVPDSEGRVDAARVAALRETLTHARRPKDAVEIDRMRRAAGATAAGYAAAVEAIRPGATERGVQIELEAAFARAGGDRPGYATIVASGPNSAVLHFAPTARKIGVGEPVLIDAGAEVNRYVIDVTRTYRAGEADGFYHELHELVRGVMERVSAGCLLGAEWRDLHFMAAVELTAGLVALDIMRGDPRELVERDAHAIFFPHGIGHMVGLGVRDAGGYLPGRQRSTRPGLSNLRTDLPLEPGYVMTVEPGVYFIPALLQDPDRRSRYRDAVNWARVDGLLDFGGIRIEDNVLVTEGLPEVLTAAIPSRA